MVVRRVGDEDLPPVPTPQGDRVAVQDRAQVGLGLPVAYLPPAKGDLDQRRLEQVLRSKCVTLLSNVTDGWLR